MFFCFPEPCRNLPGRTSRVDKLCKSFVFIKGMHRLPHRILGEAQLGCIIIGRYLAGDGVIQG